MRSLQGVVLRGRGFHKPRPHQGHAPFTLSWRRSSPSPAPSRSSSSATSAREARSATKPRRSGSASCSQKRGGAS